MIFVAGWIVAGVLALGLWRISLINQLTGLYSHSRHHWPATESLPKAAIVLSLRGHDPYLTTCLRNLMSQEYPDFVVRVVIDSQTDPAWTAIRTVQAEANSERLAVSVLKVHGSSCSLKNSSIIQAVEELPEDYEVVAFVDADAITHPTWLRELVAPLADAEVACTTGVRWFAPRGGSFADRLRCNWNLLAAAMIYQAKMPWGGSMAIRRSVLDSGLTHAWSRTFCEDAFTTSHLRDHGLRLVCVPQATIVNEENTTVLGCLKFVNRQMLILRLYHWAWWSVATGVMLGGILRLAQVYFVTQALYQGELLSLLLLVGINRIVMFATSVEASRLDRAVSQMVRKTGRKITSKPFSDCRGSYCAEVMVLLSTLYAICAGHVQWRGIKYRVKGPTEITMLAYRPFAEVSDENILPKVTIL